MVSEMPKSESRLTRRWRVMALVLGLAVAVIGAVVLVGWVLNIGTLKSVFPGLVSMKANTAIGMLLCATALALLSRRRVEKPILYLATAAALIAMVLSALTLIEYVIGWDLRIDQLFFSDMPGTVGTSQLGRMSPASSLCFVLIGAALVTAAQRIFVRLRQPIVAGLSASVTAIGALALLGYILEAGLGYHLWNYTGTAMHTATGFILLGCGLLALVRSEAGLTWYLDSTNTTAFVVAVVLMIIAAGSSYNFAKKLQETGSWVSHTQEVMKNVQEILTDVASIESNQRGFIITGDERLLQRVTEARERVPISLASVRKLSADNPNQQHRLDVLEPLIAQRIEFAERTIAARRQQSFAAAQEMFAMGNVAALTDRIGSLLKEMQDEEQTLLRSRQAQADAVSLTTFLLLPLGLFLTLTTLSLGVFLLNAGVEERSQAERAAAVSQARMAGIVNSAMDAIISVDREQRIMLFNDAAEKMFGWSVADAIGQRIDTFIPQRFREQHQQHVEGFGKTGVTSRSMRSLGALSGLRADGEEFPIEASISQIEVAEQKIFTVILRDITERKRADEALRASEDQFRTMANSIPQLAWMAHADGFIFWYNQRWHDYTGTTPEQMEGWGWQSVHDPDVLPKVLEGWRAAIATGQPFEMEFPLRGADGQFRMFLTRVQPLKDSQGDVVQWFGTNTDVDELKTMEASLRDTQVRLNSTLAAGSIGTWTWDIVNNRLVADEFTARMFSIEAEAAAKGPPAEVYLQVINQEDRPHVEDALALAIQSCGHYDIEYRVRQKEGEFRWLQARGRVEGDAAGNALNFHGAVMDITERKRAEETLQESEEQLRLAVAATKLGTWDLNLLTGERRWSSRSKALFGLPAAAEVDSEAVLRLVHPEDKARLDEAMQHALQPLSDGELHMEFRILTNHESGEQWIESQGRVLFEEGRAVRLIGTMLDITERKQAEEEVRSLNEDLEQRVAQRTSELKAVNKELEAFSYSVSHDLRAPLRHISGFSQALLEDYADQLDETGKGYLREVRSASHEMAQLIDDVLQLARVTRSEMRREVVDLSELAHSIVSELQKNSEQRKVAVSIEAGLSTLGDKRLLRIALVNLLGNAWKFTSKLEQAEISFGRQADGESIYFVRDNGAGFDMAYVDKLFGAFQRLHTAGEFEGTGIGLATVQRIISRHGGRVWAEGKPNQGATFYFTLTHLKETEDGKQSDSAG
jgi:PAS domain S-box-containing protein